MVPPLPLVLPFVLVVALAGVWMAALKPAEVELDRLRGTF